MPDTPATLAAAWRLYQRMVLSQAPDSARQLAYHVFHAGAAAMFDQLAALADAAAATQQARINALDQELQAYRREAERVRSLQPPEEQPHA